MRVTYRDKPAEAHDYDVVPGFNPVMWGDLKPRESAADLRRRAAEELAAEFDTDVSEWLV